MNPQLPTTKVPDAGQASHAPRWSHGGHVARVFFTARRRGRRRGFALMSDRRRVARLRWRRGFTLIELLVVISIMALLIAIVSISVMGLAVT
ncbi:MAG: type II secretion system protein, partial [Phycisphaerae bacterium]